MKNHLFMIHRAIEPLIYDIQRIIFDIVINRCDYIMENIRCALLNAAASYGTHRDIKFSIEQIDGMYWYKPPCGSLPCKDNAIKPLNSDSVKTIYIILRPYETIETIKRINHKGETFMYDIYRLYGKNSSYSSYSLGSELLGSFLHKSIYDKEIRLIFYPNLSWKNIQN